MKKVSEETQKLLKVVLDHFDQEDRDVRERQVRLWKKLKFYWEGYQRIYWDSVARDYKINGMPYGDSSNTTSDMQYYDKPVNIFRAYLESIIAALSITIPPITCVPDDADNNNDLETAKAGDRIASLVYKHNDAAYLWLHALFIYCTEGMIAAHNYTKTDKAYGTYKVNEYEDAEEEYEQEICSVCKFLPSDEFLSTIKRNTFDPDNQDAPIDDALNNEGDICPQCGMQFIPEIQMGKIPIKRLIGQKDEPKARQCIEVYGGLFVKVALYAHRQKDTPYLIFTHETHYSDVLEKYPELWDKFGNINSSGGLGPSGNDTYERWGRTSTQYLGLEPRENPSVRNAWLRCSSFNVLAKDDAEKLKKEFPDGCKVVFINDVFAEACNEALDDHWTLTYNPLSDYLTFQPLGTTLTNVQDITNDLISLTIQTIEQGITQTFVDPAVVNLDQYRQSESLVGGMYPAKPQSGKAVGDAFHDVKAAVLSGEVLPFAERVQSLGQTVSGALPSLFGGAQPNSSKTAAQYSMSRAQALQRLQNTWKMLTMWWKDVFNKVIPAYMKDIVEDERHVIKGANGNFINVFIRRAQLQGKIGSIELEANENLPITWAQKKDALMQLMQAGDPRIMEMLNDPANLPLVTQAIGLEEFVVPGEDDRNKQIEEIRLLIDSEPIVLPPDPMAMEMGQPPPQEQEMPSIEVEPLVDDHEVHIEICRGYLVSEAGRLLKIENPPGYKNILLHMQMHMQTLQMMQMTAAQMQPSQPESEYETQEKPEPAAQMVKKDARSSAESAS